MSTNYPLRKRGRPQRRQPVPANATHLTRGMVIEFIAERDRRPADTERSRLDRTAKLVGGAIDRGELDFSNSAGIPIMEVAAWAMTKSQLRPKFMDFHFADAIGPTTSFGGPGTVRTTPVPDSLPECQAELSAAHTRIQDLEDELEKLRGENAYLKPLAERQTARRLINQRSAKMPRAQRRVKG